jgi:hypothetical protein
VEPLPPALAAGGVPLCGVSVGFFWCVGVWVSALRRVSIDSDTLTSLFVVVQKCPLMVKATAFPIQYITYVWMLQMPTAFYATFAMDALRSGGWPCA